MPVESVTGQYIVLGDYGAKKVKNHCALTDNDNKLFSESKHDEDNNNNNNNFEFGTSLHECEKNCRGAFPCQVVAFIPLKLIKNE